MFPNRFARLWTGAALIAGALVARGAKGVDNVPAPLIVANDNGGWSWFEDERAIVDPVAGKLLVSTIANGAGVGGASRSGDVEVATVDLTTLATSRFTLRDSFPADDHNTPSLYIRPDGRYVAMYAAHGSDNFSRWRISTNPGDASAWSAEQTLNHGAGVTYSNMHYLAGDNGGAGRLYNFARSLNYDPVVTTSNDQGSTWTFGGKLLTEGGGGDRPYLRYASDGDKIHFIATERHPRNFNNSIYHGYVQDGKLYNSAGTLIDGNLFDSSGSPPSALTTVFAANTVVAGSSMQRAWTVDMAIDPTGTPTAVFQARAGGSDLDHRFFYGRWTGSQWQVNQMAFAGSYLYAAENDYTGLAAIDPSRVDVVYLSSEVHPETKAQLIGADGARHYELFRGQTSDGGASWQWTPITFNSTVDNVRPHVPKWDENNTALVWMRGKYSTYVNYNTKMVALVNPDLSEPIAALKVDFGLTGQLVQNGFAAFTRDASPSGIAQTESYSSPFAADGGAIAVTLGGGAIEFRDRGNDVAGPLGRVVDEFAFAPGSLELTFGNLAAGTYQLVLYGHDRDFSQGAYDVSLGSRRLGRMAPTSGANPSIGVASARVQFQADGDDVTLSLASLTGANVVLNGFELYAAGEYLSPPSVDLNGDGVLDFADYLLYMGGMHKNLAGLPSNEAYAMGDLNGDGKNDFADLAIFRDAYDLWNGSGAFAAAQAAPEPGAIGLMSLVALTLRRLVVHAAGR
ncbi:MAG: BNR-4 repeat-containing protein [Pirellulales bacterium]|nr:BNR-4 repeat-containing protein [Pirellulales bacterium]